MPNFLTMTTPTPLDIDMSAYYNATTLHPLGLAAVLLLGALMVLLPRRYAVIPMIVMACFVAPAQRVAPFGLDFSLLRLMVLFGWMRIVITGEYRALRWKPMDTVFVAWCVVGLVCYFLLHGSADALINRMGYMYEAAGMYFIFRILIRNWDDVIAVGVGCAIICVPVAAVLVIEQRTGRNMFAIFGGLPEYTQVREGRVRARGAFAHPIMAGSFWAVLLPIMIALIRTNTRNAFFAIAGIGAALLCIISCASSTPLIAAVMAIVAMAMIYVRRYLGWVRFTSIVALVVIHFVMVPPVWHLLARMNFVAGSTGYYRYKLLDGFINHFNEWFLIGTRSTTHWWKWGTNDLTNQYVLEGVNGGVVTLALFLILLCMGFREVGYMVQNEERRNRSIFLAWSLGASLFVHAASFLSVSYFGQIKLTLYLSLALVASLSPERITVSLRGWRVRRYSHNLPTLLPPRPQRVADFGGFRRFRS